MGTRTACGISVLSVHHTWVLDIKLKLSGLAAEIFISCAISMVSLLLLMQSQAVAIEVPAPTPQSLIGRGPAGPTGFAHSLERGRV